MFFCSFVSCEAFVFPNARKRNEAKKNGFIRTDNYRAGVGEASCGARASEVELSGAATHDGDARSNQGLVKDVQAALGHIKADTTVNVYMQPIEAGVKQTPDAIYSELTTLEVRAGR